MDSKIEELDIQLNPKLKPKEKLATEPLSSLLSNQSKNIYCCSSDLSTKFLYIYENPSNPVLQGYYYAYVYHYPICITPDILWMLIIQGFSRHVEQNSEKLRNKFVNFEGKKDLVVDCGEYEKIEDIPKDVWEEMFGNFVKKIKENVGESIINILTPCFTTTTPIIQNACQIAIMSTFKEYFKYIAMRGGCGIPYIKLQGTCNDYIELKKKIQGLLGYGIDDWINILIPIIDKIIETKKGKIDKKFWENILKNFDTMEPGMSGSMEKVEKLTGWLLNFYPFYKGAFGFGRTTVKVQRRYDFNEPILEKDLKYIAEEFIDAPFISKHRVTSEETELKCKTGFLGASLDEKFIVKPEIGWYICS